jgi:hypothetical protein
MERTEEQHTADLDIGEWDIEYGGIWKAFDIIDRIMRRGS